VPKLKLCPDHLNQSTAAIRARKGRSALWTGEPVLSEPQRTLDAAHCVRLRRTPRPIMLATPEAHSSSRRNNGA
jgi:hypothetical protein